MSHHAAPGLRSGELRNAWPIPCTPYADESKRREIMTKATRFTPTSDERRRKKRARWPCQIGVWVVSEPGVMVYVTR